MALRVLSLCSEHLNVGRLLILLFYLLLRLFSRQQLSLKGKILLVSLSFNPLDLLKLALLLHLLSEHLSVVDLAQALIGLLVLGHLVHPLLHESQPLVFNLVIDVLFIFLRFHDLSEVLLEDLHLTLVGPVEPMEIAVLFFGFSLNVVLNFSGHNLLGGEFWRPVVP